MKKITKVMIVSVFALALALNGPAVFAKQDGGGSKGKKKGLTQGSHKGWSQGKKTGWQGEATPPGLTGSGAEGGADEGNTTV